MLASIDDLVDYMSGVTLSASQRDVAREVLAGVQRELEEHLGRPVEIGQHTERVRTNEAGVAFVANTPVVAVISVFYADGGVIAPAYNDGSAGAAGVYVGSAFTDVIITYLGGYGGLTNPALKLDILRVAAREMTAEHDDTLSIKNGTVRDPEPAGSEPVGWTDAELSRWDRLRRRVVV